MKLMKNKKALASVAAILVALALIAGSTMAWFVVKQDVGIGAVPVGTLDYIAYIPWTVNGPFQPGQVAGAEYLYDADGSYLGDVYENMTDAEVAQAEQDGKFGYIINTGSLNIIIKLGNDGSLSVLRKYEDANGEFPSTGSISQGTLVEIADPADYIPGVPGAVGAALLVVPTQASLDCLGTTTQILYDENGDYYLSMGPGDKLNVAFIVDLKTNAYLSVLSAGGWIENAGFDLDKAFAKWDLALGQVNNPTFDIDDPDALPYVMTNEFYALSAAEKTAAIITYSWENQLHIPGTQGGYSPVFDAKYYAYGDASKYLDNTYMDVQINFADNWLATQADMDDAKLDIFGANIFEELDLDLYSDARNFVNSYPATKAAAIEVIEGILAGMGLTPGTTLYDDMYDIYYDSFMGYYDAYLLECQALLATLSDAFNPLAGEYLAIPLNY